MYIAQSLSKYICRSLAISLEIWMTPPSSDYIQFEGILGDITFEGGLEYLIFEIDEQVIIDSMLTEEGDFYMQSEDEENIYLQIEIQ